MTFAQIDTDNIVVGLHQTDAPFDDTEHFIPVGDEMDISLLGKVYDAVKKKFIDNPNPPATPEPTEQKKAVTPDDVNNNTLTAMESNAEIYEQLNAVKDEQLTIMESIAELYEQSNK